MNVHVPQAGNQKLAACVDDAGSRGRLDVLSDTRDTAIGNENRDVRARHCAGSVYNGGVLENDILGESDSG
jgi:hypothetical protein